MRIQFTFFFISILVKMRKFFSIERKLSFETITNYFLFLMTLNIFMIFINFTSFSISFKIAQIDDDVEFKFKHNFTNFSWFHFDSDFYEILISYIHTEKLYQISSWIFLFKYYDCDCFLSLNETESPQQQTIVHFNKILI